MSSRHRGKSQRPVKAPHLRVKPFLQVRRVYARDIVHPLQSSGGRAQAPYPETTSSSPVSFSAASSERTLMDVTDATFETEVINRSATTPVVVDLWAPWCEPCKSLGPILEKVIGGNRRPGNAGQSKR